MAIISGASAVIAESEMDQTDSAQTSSLQANSPVADAESLDRELCRRGQAGDNDACAQLFKRHEKRIARLMWRFARDRGTQAELVQEVFVQAYLSLPRYKPSGVPFEHWLVRIGTRVGYQFWKKQARSRLMQPLTEAVYAPAPETDAIDPSAAAQMLHDLLALLPAPDRLVLTLMYFEECTMKEIGTRTGWNIAVVKMRAYRARNRLKAIIERKKMTEILKEIIHGTA